MDDDAAGGDAGFDEDFDEDQASDLGDGDLPEMDGGDDDAADDFDMDARVGHLSRADIADLSPQEQLQKWHEMLLSAEVDLISELDASNIFFINAESIICDLRLSAEVNEDGQFLRMTFMVEQLLSSIKSCGGVYRIIFFDAFKHVFSMQFEDSLWAFREAFLSHCRNNGIDHAVFSHWYSPEWKEHVSTWRPSFFLLADDGLAVEDEEEDEEEAEQNAKLRGSFQALMLRCLSYKVHVALLKGLQRRGNRVMAFTLEPDNHDLFIDKNVQGALQPLLEEEDEDEDENQESPVPALVAFKKRGDGKVQETALLRCFLVASFCKDTLAIKADPASMALMKLFVKVMLIQEMMLRYVPLDKRAFTTIASDAWELYAESISGALDRFYAFISKELGRLNREPEAALQGLKLDACDLFDGRLFRHLFRFIVETGLSEKSKEVKADAFKFSSYIVEELDFLWSEASSKEKFFPLKISAMKDLEGLEPPDLPDQARVRERPSLFKIQSGLFDAMWKEKADNLKEIDEDEAADPPLLWDRYSWKQGVRVDAIQEVQEMEKNEAEKRMEQKMREKKKITDKDREYERKFHMKRRQMALRSLHRYAKSLTGSDKLHLPIVSVKADQKKEDQKKEAKKKAKPEEKVEKVSKKQQEILDKNRQKELEKTQAQDAQQLNDWEKPVDALAEAPDVSKLEKDLLDLLIGFNRVVPSFVGFPALTNAFKTPEAQVAIIVKAVKSLRVALKKLQLDRLPPEAQPKVTSLVVYVYCLVQEAWNSYGKKGLFDGKPQRPRPHEVKEAEGAKRHEKEEEFDEYADEFEDHLVNTLEYHLPEVIASKMACFGPFSCCMDLGCGTGLCGRALKTSTQIDKLIGVDLSEGMLARAREAGGYDELQQRDLVAALGNQEVESVDLLVAADVLIYVRHLDRVFALAHRVLRAEGVFVFSTEAAGEEESSEGAVQRESGRYAHCRSFIAATASPLFAVVEVETIPLRIEDDLPLQGDVFVLQRRPGSQCDDVDVSRACIKLFQELLISLGFRNNAQGMFRQWKQVQATLGKDEGAEDGDGKDKKGKDAKDDKKDKKKDKDSKDKKDKKESKDSKEDSLDSYAVTKEVELCWSGVGSDEYAFQLMYMGPQMTRLVGTAKAGTRQALFRFFGLERVAKMRCMKQMRRSSMKEPLPVLHLAFLCVLEGAYFYTICNIFSFAGILSVDLGWAPDKNEAGFVAGWLLSANVFGRIFTSPVWGFVAGRYGIKVVLVITLVSMLVGGILFGFCTNLIAAMTVRFILFGLLNGWLVLTGPCAVAAAGRERQTEVLGLIFAAGCGMQLIGPAIGGWTYGTFEELPALLPSLVGCGLSILASVLLFAVRKTFAQEELAVKATKAEPRLDLPKRKALIFQKPLPLILFMRFVAGCASYTMNVAVPLWLISDPELGGLGMTEKSVGSFLCRSAVWYIIYFTWVLPWCSKQFGSRCYSIVVSVVAAVTACFLPFSPNIPVANVLHLVWASALIGNNVLNVAFTNNACPQNHFMANGLAVTAETVGKAVGPAASASIFAWTLRTWGWHGHGALFFMLAGCSIIQILCVLCLPDNVEPACQPVEEGPADSSIASKEEKVVDSSQA
ncbi:ZIFL2 [Symbiodinium natans]|uniref:ZIFL2 protein n=1 Tax=Symbiodinium natans TaxID=878477 RepID=A0A812IZK6_9DINO|nr:ZIFL2 [Symbiodinium natans]